ncbi:Cobalt-precorrin-3 C(17)-methyltransferase [hydrothermal vent metagenome]|uniref:Cobalt-precorrin-3 C(17)-methyltransferase n=1 Tax=hydrothermal vent metagenome TaxID=652676 RepID=A0A3B1DHS9_9ZZZZ
MNTKMGYLYIVGIGPGNEENITPAALNAIREANVVIGYSTYIQLVKHLIEGKEIVKAGMTEEIERARMAIETAQEGKKVAVISSGDAGVYGMAGLIFEVLKDMNWKKGDSPELKIFPGITAINSCASLVGAPLVHDACTISLSDQLTPWPTIEKKIEAAASADFVIGLYNPKSGRRTEQIVIAQKIISKYRSLETPVALIKSAYRRRENVIMSDLANFLENDIGMLTTVIIGNSNTFLFEGYMVTPRGYTNKYTWDGETVEGQERAVPLRLDEKGVPVGGGL